MQRNAFGVFTKSHQRKAKVGFDFLLLEIQRYQGPPNEMHQPRAHHRVDQRHPHHIPLNFDGAAAQREAHRARQAPQNCQKRPERDHRRHKAQREIQRAVDKLRKVIGDTLIGVVGVPRQLQAIVRTLGDPVLEVVVGQPAAPADLQHLVEIKLVNRGDNKNHRQPGEAPE